MYLVFSASTESIPASLVTVKAKRLEVNHDKNLCIGIYFKYCQRTFLCNFMTKAARRNSPFRIMFVDDEKDILSTVEVRNQIVLLEKPL